MKKLHKNFLCLLTLSLASSSLFAAQPQLAPSPLKDPENLPKVFTDNEFTVSAPAAGYVYVIPQNASKEPKTQRHLLLQTQAYDVHGWIAQLVTTDPAKFANLNNRITSHSPFNMTQFAIGFDYATYPTTRAGKKIAVVPFSAYFNLTSKHPLHGIGAFSTQIPVTGLLRVESSDKCFVRYGAGSNELSCTDLIVTGAQVKTDDGYDVIVGNDNKDYYFMKNLVYQFIPDYAKTKMQIIGKKLNIDVGEKPAAVAKEILDTITQKIIGLTPDQMQRVVKLCVYQGQLDLQVLTDLAQEMNDATSGITDPRSRTIVRNNIIKKFLDNMPK